MRQICTSAALLTATLLLSACSGDVERAFGLTRDAPDEFTVTTRAPLSMPPDYTLTPPRPGASRPQELSAQQAAEAALVPGAVLGGTAGPDSAGQQALVNQAGPPAPPDIREKINQEASLDNHGGGLTDTLLFWRSTPPPGSPLDPAKESQRLRENAALGQSPTVGQTPIIQDKKPSSGFLGIF
jgi:Protein of unknown function (DUF3035)